MLPLLFSMVVMLVMSAGCSLTTTDFVECQSNSVCRRHFGLGSVCSVDGLCDSPDIPARCTGRPPLPADLFSDPEGHRDTIVFGNLMDRTLATHQAREDAARLAIKLANDEGGPEGRKFGLIFCTVEENGSLDSLSRSEAPVEAALFLAETIGVPAIIGPASSGDTQNVFNALKTAGRDVVVISPSATSPALTALDPEVVTDFSPGRLWRTAPPDSLQGRVIARDLRQPGAGRLNPVGAIAVIYEQGPYGEGLATVLAEEFMAQGGATVDLRPYSSQAARDEAITTAPAGVEEVVFISSQATEIVAFLNAAAQVVGYDGKGIFLTDAAANADVIGTADMTRFGQVRGTRPAPLDTSDLVYALFLASFSAEYSGRDANEFSFTANAWDAAWMTVYGATWAVLQENEVRGLTVARGLRKLSAGTSVENKPTDFGKVKQQFAAGNSIDIRGASGELDYDENEETSGDIQTWRITGTSIVPIETFES